MAPSPSARVRMHECIDLTDVDRVERSAIPVTTTERTLIDLGAVVHRHKVEQAFGRRAPASAHHARGGRRPIRTGCRRGRRGVGVLRPLLEKRLGNNEPSTGEFERKVGRLLVRVGIGPPSYEYVVRMEAGRLRRPSRSRLRDLRIAIECDSDQWRSGPPAPSGRPRPQNRLVLAGWTILRFTWEALVHRPEIIKRGGGAEATILGGYEPDLGHLQA